MDVSCAAYFEFPSNYVLNLLPLSSHGVVTLLSDGSIRILPNSPETWTTVGSKIYTKPDSALTLTGLRAYDENVFAVSGSNGVNLYDLRTGSNSSVASFVSASAVSLLCLDVKDHKLAAGSELVGSDASVLLWDLRSKKSIVSYLDSHNDDVTEISFHPTQSNALLSGSTDGLINIFNTDITDEDDAVYQAINHEASIHRAGFLSDKRIFGLSHMETLSVYQWADPDENVEEPKPNEFGDLRQRLGCEYVSDIIVGAANSASYIATGSNNETQNFKLIPFANEAISSSDSWINLVGAHGEEVVRSVVIGNSPLGVLTGGEDGIVKYWNAGIDQAATEDPWTTVEKKEKKSKDKKKDKHKDKHSKKEKKRKEKKRYAPY